MDTVLVTGGTRGLGFAIGKRLQSAGYRVVLVSRSCPSECSSWLDTVSDAHFEAFDFEQTDAIYNFAQSLIKKYGRFFGLVNNAALGQGGILGTMHASDISRMLTINIEAPILLTKYLSRSMLLNQKGRIVNISSIIGSTGFNGLSVYGATKSALNGFTKSLSRELGKANITVNSVAPGYMETGMTEGLEDEQLKKIKRRSPLGRLAHVDDVANMVEFLLSEKARMITGTIMTVDGGSTA